MSDYLNSRNDQALEQLIKRSEAAEKLTSLEHQNLETARRILAERSAANVATHFDIPRAISFLTSVAKEGRLCSYKELAFACVSDPDAEWSRLHRRLTGPSGLMISIIRHCEANNLPHFSSLVVRQDEVHLGPSVPPNRDDEAEYGFKRGMVEEGLEKQGVDTDAMVLKHRQSCFDWATSL